MGRERELPVRAGMIDSFLAAKFLSMVVTTTNLMSRFSTSRARTPKHGQALFFNW